MDGLKLWVPDLLERSGLKFTEADGFFRLTVEKKKVRLGGTALFPTPCAGRHVRGRVRLSAAFAWLFA